MAEVAEQPTEAVEEPSADAMLDDLISVLPEEEMTFPYRIWWKQKRMQSLKKLQPLRKSH